MCLPPRSVRLGNDVRRLRLLCVQDDIADRVITMIAGAARELAIGDPRDAQVHIGPVIDADAKARLDAHIARMKHTALRPLCWRNTIDARREAVSMSRLIFSKLTP